MNEEDFFIRTKIQIQKPVADVYEAIADPLKLSGYFIRKGSGRLDENHDIIWQFPEFDEEVPIKPGKNEKNRLLTFYWDNDGIECEVKIELERAGTNETVATVTETCDEFKEAGIKWLKGNTAGWANFLDCLKAYLEYGINLRKGAFEFMREK